MSIKGNSKAALEAARDKLDVVKKMVPVKAELVDGLIGKGGKEIRKIEEKTRVISANIEERGKNTFITLIGSNSTVQAAEVYMEFLSEFLEEKKEIVGEITEAGLSASDWATGTGKQRPTREQQPTCRGQPGWRWGNQPRSV